MGAVVERLAGAIDFEPVPVVRVYVVTIGTAGDGTLPQIPGKLRRHRHFLPCPNRLPNIAVPGFREVGPANGAGANFVDDLNRVPRRTLLRPHLYQLSVFLLCLNEQCSFGRIVAAGLLYVDVLSRLQTGDCHRGMPVVGSGNANRVDLFAVKNLAKILLGGCGFSHLLLGGVGELLKNPVVRVADVGDASGVPVRFER